MVQLCIKTEGSDKFGTNLDRKSWLIVKSTSQVLARKIKELRLRVEPAWHPDKHDVIIDIQSNINDYFICAFPVCL